jgi:hypothetical protein
VVGLPISIADISDSAADTLDISPKLVLC